MEWLSHDYGSGELWIYRRWTHIPEWSYACQNSWVRLANNLSGWQIIYEKFQNSKWTDPLTKLNTIKSCYVENIWLWLECVCVEEPFYVHSTLINVIIKA
jgi:hypothetical protein